MIIGVPSCPFKRGRFKVEGRHPKEEERVEICEYIESYYNKRRRDTALGYAIPIALTHCSTV
ncbi:MAG: hypothetical protein LBB61_05345 [Treponema sp.]|nr:hypothetical protein [Treponema sp.]